jgi:hypothetical protein
VWCRDRHGRRFLCDGAKAVLDNAIERAKARTQPAVAYNEQVELVPDPAADAMVGTVLIKAGLYPGPGVQHPALVITGRDTEGRQLPNWIYVADDATLRALPPMVNRMVDLAIAQADKKNRAR